METNYFFDVNEKFKKLILQCLDELKELNFPIPTSVYFREGTGLRIYGLCYSDKFYKKYKDYDFVISINKNLILEKDIKETISITMSSLLCSRSQIPIMRPHGF